MATGPRFFSSADRQAWALHQLGLEVDDDADLARKEHADENAKALELVRIDGVWVWAP